MTSFLELVKKRKSIRKYSPRPVAREAIDRCLEAARLAPSACNSQPWSFIIVDDEALREKISKAAFSGVYSINSFASKAPALIAVVTERSRYIARVGGYFRGIQFSLVDVAIACEHFILQAAEEGLGTCWLGWFNEKRVKEILNIPKRKKVDIIISMGYPEEATQQERGRRNLDEIRKFNLGRH
ncbi:MAG: nitroreductase family protein [Candidatus Gorgyraea atricola]|nr:nitroreductase family protein [Candidatus Gorgyraea atricola]